LDDQVGGQPPRLVGGGIGGRLIWVSDGNQISHGVPLSSCGVLPPGPVLILASARREFLTRPRVNRAGTANRRRTGNGSCRIPRQRAAPGRTPAQRSPATCREASRGDRSPRIPETTRFHRPS